METFLKALSISTSIFVISCLSEEKPLLFGSMSKDSKTLIISSEEYFEVAKENNFSCNKLEAVIIDILPKIDTIFVDAKPFVGWDNFKDCISKRDSSIVFWHLTGGSYNSGGTGGIAELLDSLNKGK